MARTWPTKACPLDAVGSLAGDRVAPAYIVKTAACVGGAAVHRPHAAAPVDCREAGALVTCSGRRRGRAWVGSGQVGQSMGVGLGQLGQSMGVGSGTMGQSMSGVRYDGAEHKCGVRYDGAEHEWGQIS